MTDWEQKELFSRLDRIASILEVVAKNTNIELGLDVGGETCIEDCPTIRFDVAEEKKEETAASKKPKSRLAEDKEEYRNYKSSGGELKWNEWHSRKRNGTLPS